MQNERTISIIPTRPQAVGTAFIDYCLGRDRSPNTLDNYRRVVRAFGEYAEGRGMNDLSAIAPADLEAFFAGLYERMNQGGVHNYYRVIRALYNWYWFAYELEGRNPISRVRLASPPPVARPGIPLEHFERLLAACRTAQGLRDRSLLLCALDSCARASELAGMRVGDVDWSSGHVLIVHGKGRRFRTVRFGAIALRALRRYLRAGGTDLPASQPLWTTDSGNPLTRFSLRLLLDRRIADAGIPHYGLHDIRRRGAYLLYQNGMGIKELQRYLGHASVTTTERYLAIEDGDVLAAHRRASPVDRAGL